MKQIIQTNRIPKVVDRIYMAPFTSGYRKSKIHCEFCGEDIEQDPNHVVYTIEFEIEGSNKKKVKITFCKHSHKHAFLKQHPEVLDYIENGISNNELKKHPEWEKYHTLILDEEEEL